MSEPKAVNPFAKHLNIRFMLNNMPPPIDEVVAGLPVGTVGMLAGPGGVGKTMFELQVALSIAAGLPILRGALDPDQPGPVKPAKVVLIAAEEPSDILWRRIRQIAYDLVSSTASEASFLSREELTCRLDENLHVSALSGELRANLLNEDLSASSHAEALLEISEGARLVMIDPLRQFHLCDENESKAMAAFVAVIAGYAQRGKAAWLLTHHVNRASMQQGTGETPGAARGSTALTDGVRWQLNLSRLTKETAKQHGVMESKRQHYLLADLAKANYCAPRPPTLLERTSGGTLRPAQVQA